MRHPLLKKLDNDRIALNWAFFRAGFAFCFAISFLLSCFLLYSSGTLDSLVKPLCLLYFIPAFFYVLAGIFGERSVAFGISSIIIGFSLSTLARALIDINIPADQALNQATSEQFEWALTLLYFLSNAIVLLSALHAFLRFSPYPSNNKTNIILIGMPGAGKSTVGKHFAERRNLHFLDTDHLIEKAAQTSLQTIVNRDGHETLRALEAECLNAIKCEHTVISTGGSAVYSPAAMAHLATLGPIFYLAHSLEVIKDRIGDHSARGLAKPATQSLEQLYEERHPLYLHYADQQLDCKGLTPEAVCDLLESSLNAAQRGSSK